MNNYHAYMSDLDLPPSPGEPVIVDEPEDADRDPDEGDPEPTSRFEDSATYRDQLKDAGRGHLV